MNFVPPPNKGANILLPRPREWTIFVNRALADVIKGL